MKRAEVFQTRPGSWQVFVWDERIPDRGEAIPLRDCWGADPFWTRLCCTHEEALRYALAEVGLDQPAEHREAP